jgi:pimeloyl-ACP methyl ester carboxylesterase
VVNALPRLAAIVLLAVLPSTHADARDRGSAERSPAMQGTIHGPQVHYRRVRVGDVEIFYREAGPADAPVLLLLHGFPSSSHQYRDLLPRLARRWRVIAPDYPGFGHSDAPEPASAGGSHAYTFDALAGTMAGFCDALGLRRFALYMFDFGGPVGMRLAERHPERIAGIVIQNANAYEEGLSPSARELVALRPGMPGAREQARALLQPETTRWQYLEGAADPARVSPDAWTMDQHFLDLPGRDRIQVDLALDYHRNVALYPRWQAWLRDHRPPALVLWGRHDPIFVEPGAHAYLRDLPEARLHLFDGGHFMLEEYAAEAATLVDGFLDGLEWAGAGAAAAP